MSESVETILAVQRSYYDERAPDYMQLSKPSDRKARGWLPDDVARALIDDFAPAGDVLELACGPGTSTRHLVRHASTLTLVDGSARMLERARGVIEGANATFIEADIFEWEPDRNYDAVFFSAWLSHVPPERFADFWSLVRRCLRPNGRVAFLDEDDRGAVNDDVTIVEGVPVAPRTLADGRMFDIVKVFWRPAELQQRLDDLGWAVSVRPVDETYLFGIGTTREG